MSRSRVCLDAELVPGTAQVVALGPDERGIAQQVLVVRDEGDTPRAYLNVCQHLPIPLDGGSGDYFDPSGKELFCGTHGARYRLSDGLCVFGPCKGRKLEAVPVEVEHGVVYIARG